MSIKKCSKVSQKWKEERYTEDNMGRHLLNGLCRRHSRLTEVRQVLQKSVEDIKEKQRICNTKECVTGIGHCCQQKIMFYYLYYILFKLVVTFSKICQENKLTAKLVSVYRLTDTI